MKIDVILDVGANSGQWASELTDKKQSFKIISFEPVNEVFDQLAFNSKDNEKWEVHNLAMIGNEDFSSINISSNGALSSSLLEMTDDHLEAAPHSFFQDKQIIKTGILADWIDDGLKYFLKLDVQGMELEILKKVPNVKFDKIEIIELETSLVPTYFHCALLEDVITFLRTKGFKPFRIENGLGKDNFGQMLQVDILFTKS